MSRSRRRSSGPPNVDLDDLANYDGTPWLTALANFCLAVGVFVGAYAVIFLIGAWHRGLSACSGLIAILVIDVAINLLVQLVRAQRRRAAGLTRERRRRGVGL